MSKDLIKKVAKAIFEKWMRDWNETEGFREYHETWEEYSNKEYFYDVAQAAIAAIQEGLPSEEEIGEMIDVAMTQTTNINGYEERLKLAAKAIAERTHQHSEAMND